MFLGSYIVNDLHRINQTEVLKKVRESTRFSFSFIFLLIGSSIVCTLGLLLNSTAVVIGGMMVSPLMWPLMQTALGISYGRIHYIRRALLLLVVASLISLFSAYLITLLSPIKILNDEIILRTNPTLLDLLIAIVAGAVAAMALTQPKISESLAGVAIATSLMPPVCVSGIGLALNSFSVFWGGLLLYFANIISIIFIGVLVFLWAGFKNQEEPTFQIRAISITAAILILTSVPLFILLRQYAFKAVAYSQAENVLIENFFDLSESSYVSNVKTSINSEGVVFVSAEVLVPEDLTISFEERQKIKDDLERALNRKVELQLQLQNTISILSKEDIESTFKRDLIETTFLEEISKIQSDLTVDSLEISTDKQGVWKVNAVLRGSPNISFSYNEQQQISSALKERLGEDVELNLEIVSRVKIQSNPDIKSSQIENEVQKYFAETFEGAEIDSIAISGVDSDDTIRIKLDIEVENSLLLPQSLTEDLTSLLEDQFSQNFDIIVKVFEYVKIEFQAQ